MNREINEVIEKINRLKDEISDLDYFNRHILSGDNTWRNGGGKYAVNCFLKKETSTRVTLLGNRWFGCGTHKQELRLPNSVLNDVHLITMRHQQRLEDELAELLKGDNNG